MLPNLFSSREFSSPSRTVVKIVDEQVQRGERILRRLAKLLEARCCIEQSGVPLLSREELDRERVECRGDVDSR